MALETTESLLGRGPTWWSQQVSKPGSFYRNDTPSTPPTSVPTPSAGQPLISMGERKDVSFISATPKFLDGHCAKPLPAPFLCPPLLSASLLTTFPSSEKSCPCSSLRLGSKLNKGPQKGELEGTLGTSCSWCRAIQRPMVYASVQSHAGQAVHSQVRALAPHPHPEFGTAAQLFASMALKPG